MKYLYSYNVNFKFLDFSLNIKPVAFEIFGFEIMFYGIIIACAILASILYIYYSNKFFKINKEKLDDVVLLTIISAFIGARLYYVLFYPGNIYKKNPLSIFYIHHGGLAIYGGILAGIIAATLISKFEGLKVLKVLDILSLGLLLGQSIGRWGNFINQEAFGYQTTLPWGMKSEATLGLYVHPCFLYESLWCLLGFFLSHTFILKHKKRDGEILSFYFIWYGLGRFFIEALRSDSLYLPHTHIKISQLVALLSFTVGVISLYFIKKKKTIKS